MRKRFLAVLASLCCVLMMAHAQTIKSGNVFWDGTVRYVATVIGSDIYLNGRDADGGMSAIKLRKNGKTLGEYQLAKAKADDVAPYGCMFGCRVQYVNQSGIRFLAFYVEEHTAGQALVLTTDGLSDLVKQQRFAEREQDGISLVSTWLMNQRYLSQVHPEELQRMMNKIQRKQKRNIIESTNLDMMAYANAVGLYSGDECSVGKSQSGDASTKVVEVSNEFDFIGSLGSNRTLLLKPGTVLNLTSVLNQDGFFSYEGRCVADDYHAGRKGTEQMVVACNRFDGRQLELINVNNLTIRGSEDCYIVVEPRYANVLNFYNCSNITIENLTVGHTDEGYCEGGVLLFEDCEAIGVKGCDLYGCGTYGLETRNVRGLVMENTTIRDCSYGIMEVHNTNYALFGNCNFMRCRQFSLVNIDGDCENVQFDSCRWSANHGMLFNLGTMIKMTGCEIRHAANEEIGNTEMILMEGNSNIIERN